MRALLPQKKSNDIALLTKYCPDIRDQFKLIIL